MRRHLDLCSGIGGFALAAKWAGLTTVGFAEIDNYASRVLKRHWPHVPNYGDISNVPKLKNIYLLTAGFPCQPYSVAGKRKGAADDRAIWPQVAAVIERTLSRWILLENVLGILSLNDGLEFERICLALEGQGYEVQSLIIPACAVGAPHRRDRVWIVAHSNRKRELQPQGTFANERGRFNNQAQATFANDWPQRVQRVWKEAVSWIGAFQRGEDGRRIENERIRLDLPEPLIRRNGNGLSAELDERIKCLGNSVVPQVPYQLIRRMIEAEESCAVAQ